MSKISTINSRLSPDAIASNLIKDKIEDIALNKGVSIVDNTDTPLSVLTKIDNATVKTPTETINITQNGTTDVTNYASAVVNVQPNLQSKSLAITQNGTQVVEADSGYDGLSGVTLTINVSGGGSEKIEIVLPSTFASAYEINYFQVDSNRILLGGGGVTGVWLHNISTNSTTQIYSSYQYWVSKVQQVGNNFLIGANYLSTYGLLLYKPSDDTITNLVSGNKNFSYFTPISNTLCACSDGYNVGIHIYDDSTQTATQVITGSQEITASAKVGDKYILTNGSSSGSSGIYLYNDNTKTCSQLVSTGRGYANMQTFGDYILISSISSSYKGILVFDSTNDSLSTAYSTGYNWVFQIAGTKCISSSSVNSSSTVGLLVFDTAQKQMTQVYSSGYNWFKGFTDISATTHLLSGSNGILKFDSAADTAELVLSSSGGNIFKHVSENKIVIAGNSYNIILYDITNSSASVLYTESNVTFYTILENGNDLLISGTYMTPGNSSETGLILYNSTNSTATSIYHGGGQYDTVEAVSSNTYYISSSAEEVMYKLLYNSSDKTAQLYSIRIGG